MTFTLLPTIGPWVVGFLVLVGASLLLAAVALVDAFRQRPSAVATPVTETVRPARRATARLHHA